MAAHDTKRVSSTTASPDAPPTAPAQSTGEPDNESQYGGGRQVAMPREQNRETVNPPKANRQKAPAHNGRLPDSHGPGGNGARK